MAKGKPDGESCLRASCFFPYTGLVVTVVLLTLRRQPQPVQTAWTGPPARREWGHFDFCADSPCARQGRPPNQPRTPTSAAYVPVEPEYARDHWAAVERDGVPRFDINTHDPASQDVHISGAIHRRGPPWDPHIWAYLAHVLRLEPRLPGAFVDVGANIGYFSLMAASLGYNVSAFEPMNRNVAKLMASVERNGFGRRIRIYHNAVGQDACGGVSLAHTHPTNQGNGRIIEGLPGPIPTVRLDDALDEDVAVLKIDVEGGESQVLAGARRLICEHRVRYIIMEMSVDTVVRPDCPIYDTLRTMEAIGYAITDVVRDAPRLSPHDVARFPPNVVLRLEDASVPPIQRVGARSACSFDGPVVRDGLD